MEAPSKVWALFFAKKSVVRIFAYQIRHLPGKVFANIFENNALPTRFKISILWLWVVSLLSATVGISVHQIYCYCVGKTTFSIFDEAKDACAMQVALPMEEACCSSDAPSCCSMDAGADHHDCTKKTVKVFQLKTEYLVVQPLDKIFEFPVWADEFPEFLKLYRPVICEAAVLNKAPPEPPPPISGRGICLRHEIFLC